MQGKKVSESFTTFSEIVMPNDTNPMQNLMGGNLLKWMDIACGICGVKHANRIVVTAAVDNVSFSRPIRIGDIVTVTARVTRAFHTSMEIFVEVFKENLHATERIRCNEAHYTFVALDDDGRPVEVPPVIPETEEDRQRFDSALRRRELRLVLAGRLKPEDTRELRAIFTPPGET